MPTRKGPPSAYRLTPQAQEQIARVAAEKGVSRTAIVEMAVREYAARHDAGTAGREAPGREAASTRQPRRR